MQSVKNIETLQQKNGERFILLDSNIHILANRKVLRQITALSGKCNRYDAKIVLPNIVLHEVSNVTKLSKNEILEKIYSTYKHVLILDVNSNITAEAKRMETQFLYCHSADSIILSTAKMLSAVLVTSDKKLRQVAEFEGVEVYSINKFLTHWRLI